MQVKFSEDLLPMEHGGMLQLRPDAGRVVPEFNLEHIRELIHALFRVVYLMQAKKEVVLIRVWRSERQPGRQRASPR